MSDRLEHVKYEYKMFLFSFSRLTENNFASDSDKFIYLESFLLHSRCLLDFFKNKAMSEVDNYYDGKIDDILYGDLHCFLAHITDERIGAIKKVWNIQEVSKKVSGCYSKFYDALNPEKQELLIKPEFNENTDLVTSTFSSNATSF